MLIQPYIPGIPQRLWFLCPVILTVLLCNQCKCSIAWRLSRLHHISQKLKCFEMYPSWCLQWSTISRSSLIFFFIYFYFILFIYFLIPFWSYPSAFPSCLRRFLCKYSKCCVYFISIHAYCRDRRIGISVRQLPFLMCVSKCAIASVIKETTCAIRTILQTQRIPSSTEEIIKEFVEDFKEFSKLQCKYRWIAHNQMPSDLRQLVF